MVKLFCLSVFSRKSKVAKAVLGSDSSKGMDMSDQLQGMDGCWKSQNIANKIKVQPSVDAVVANDATSSTTEPSSLDASNGQLAGKLVATVTMVGDNTPSCVEMQVSSQDNYEAIVREADSHSCSGDEAHEYLEQHHAKLDIDSQDDSGNDSCSEFSDVESHRQFSEDSSKPSGAHAQQIIQGEIQHDLVVEDVATTVKGEQLAGYEGESSNTSTYAFEAGMMVVVDDILAGHLSDPGFYRREGSLNGLSPFPNDSPIMPDTEDLSTSLFKQNYESQSCGAISRTSEGIENFSVETVKDGLEPSCLNTESTTSKPGVPGLSSSLGYCSDGGEIGHPQYPLVAKENTSVTAFLAPEGTEGAVQESASAWVETEWTSSPAAESSRSRVEKWISNIQLLDFPLEVNDVMYQGLDHTMGLDGEVVTEGTSKLHHQVADAMSMDHALANAAIRSLNVTSTAAHISGLGLREVPLMGAFSFLKTLNLSANRIARIPAGSLPRSLHSLDLSRNKISVIEGFREVTRLRALNLSHNRIARIGHGLANCTLIKELYLAGNKIAEVEGLHRLLKLSVLDLSYNKLATSKALGQLAANYSSLLALNLLGNPVLLNCGEEQLRKMIMSITPHVTYLNKQPIKAVSVREAVVDSVARAALGTSQRTSRMKRVSGPQAGSHKKVLSHRKEGEKRLGVVSSEHDSLSSTKLPKQHRHHHHHHHSQHLANDGHNRKKGKESSIHSSKTPIREKLLRNLALDTGAQAMHRSRSESALQE